MIQFTEFAMRQFEENSKGTNLSRVSVNELLVEINKVEVLCDGYAPFCKHAFIPNKWDIDSGIAKITSENCSQLRSGYRARRQGELPVLTRWFEGIKSPRAEWLDVVLYSAKQLTLEWDILSSNCTWGIVAINAGLEPIESPMLPATMLRNALGVEQGGSGVAIDSEAYLAGVKFWEEYALIG